MLQRRLAGAPVYSQCLVNFSRLCPSLHGIILYLSSYARRLRSAFANLSPEKNPDPPDFRLARCTRRSLRYVARTFGTNGTGTQTFAYPRADGANELAHRFLPENLSHQAGTERRSATGSFYSRRCASTLRPPAAACREFYCNRVWRDHAGINELPLESPPLLAFGRQEEAKRWTTIKMAAPTALCGHFAPSRS